MRNRWLTVEPDQPLEFCQGFNVAEPFIDRHLIEGRADKVAIRSVDGDVTYAQLAERVNRCANVLTDLKMTSGDRLCMVIKDCPAFFYVFWGAIKAGVIPVPLNTLLRARDFAFMVENSQCSAIIYSSDYAAEVEAALECSSHRPRHHLAVEDRPGSLLALLADQSDRFTAVSASATDDCFWLYSSGSTGQPKGAVHLHRDMVVSSEFYGVQTLGLVETDICFSAAKLFFAYGLGNGMTFPLWIGGTTVLLGPRPTPQNIFETIGAFCPSIFFGVPTLYASMLQATTDIDTVPVSGFGRAPPASRGSLDVSTSRLEGIIPASYNDDTLPVSGRDDGPARPCARSQGRGCARPASEGSLDESPSRLDGINLSSVRAYVSAGEALPAPLFHRWQERTGFAILDGLGSTELLHIFISNRSWQVRPGSSGIPVHGYQAQILDEYGHEAKTGDPGRLFIKGLSAARYYWNNPEKTAATMVGD